jgi:hypothetical protein
MEKNQDTEKPETTTGNEKIHRRGAENAEETKKPERARRPPTLRE